MRATDQSAGVSQEGDDNGSPALLTQGELLAIKGDEVERRGGGTDRGGEDHGTGHSLEQIVSPEGSSTDTLARCVPSRQSDGRPPIRTPDLR